MRNLIVIIIPGQHARAIRRLAAALAQGIDGESSPCTRTLYGRKRTISGRRFKRCKAWMLRTVVQGRRRDVGLGNTELVSLSEARELAIAFRRTARAGGDPTAERRRQRISVPTFEDASWRTRAEHKSAWRNAKSRVDQIETPDILRVLSPIWLTKPETARRLRQRIGSVPVLWRLSS